MEVENSFERMQPLRVRPALEDVAGVLMQTQEACREGPIVFQFVSACRKISANLSPRLSPTCPASGSRCGWLNGAESAC
jgi:hypothetical protein